MKYTVYCDESRHSGPREHRYMAIGGLWVPTEEKERITAELRALRRRLDLMGEVKWSKVNRSRLTNYSDLVDVFLREPRLQFRVIVVDQSRVDLGRHDGDAELGFYKFYYEMLEKWIEPSNEYLILLDFKQNYGSRRYSDLKTILSSYATKIKAGIHDLTVIDSRQSQLAQLNDILTGATAAACCADLPAASAKAALIRHIETGIGQSLRGQTSTPARCKFNVFRIGLS